PARDTPAAASTQEEGPALRNVPSRIPWPCRWPGCRLLITHGTYCQPHERRTGALTNTRPLPPNWWKLRKMVLAEEPFCRKCKEEGRIVRATQVDHIIARADGGTDDRENLQGLCDPHGAQKTWQETHR